MFHVLVIIFATYTILTSILHNLLPDKQKRLAEWMTAINIAFAAIILTITLMTDWVTH
jgi:hypothetical protein